MGSSDYPGRGNTCILGKYSDYACTEFRCGIWIRGKVHSFHHYFQHGDASALWRTTSNAWATGLALILGGAFGNLYDRLFRPPAAFSGHVIDFISVGQFPVFNVADSAVTIGVVIVLICLLVGKKLTVSPAAEKTDASSQVSHL